MTFTQDQMKVYEIVTSTINPTNFDHLLRLYILDPSLNEATVMNVLQNYRNVVEAICHDSSLDENAKQLRVAFLSLLIAFKALHLQIYDRSFDMLLNSDNSINYLKSVYGIPDVYRVHNISFHKFGSTSIIFKAFVDNFGREVAIKLVKPFYFDNTKIAQSTRSYKDAYSSVKTRHTAEIFVSGERYVIMEFLDGLDLFEYWTNHLRNSNEITRLERVATIIQCLCDTLSKCQRLAVPLSHLDINPKNIIINSDLKGDIKNVYLVDFGKNYLMGGGVSEAMIVKTLIDEVSPYVAPDVFAVEEMYYPQGDTYSIGVIILQLLSVGRLSSIGKTLAKERLWDDYPFIAEFVEDVIQEDPDSRNTILCSVAAARNFDDVFRQFNYYLKSDKVRLNVKEELEKHEGNLLFEVGDYFLASTRSAISIFLNSLKTSRELKESALYRGGASFWASISIICNTLIVAAFFILVMADLGKKYDLWFARSFYEAIEQIVSFTHIRLKWASGDLWNNLPGRLVCLSFSLIATKYFINVYANISANRFGGGSKLADMVRKSNSWSYFPPIMVAMIYDPKLWPYCVFVGVLPVVINNFVFSRFISHSDHAGSEFEKSKFNEFKTTFGLWWLQMFLYATGVLIIGILLTSGRAVDELVYAVVVFLVNHFQISRVAVGLAAPEIRSKLNRLCFLSERNKLYMESGNRLTSASPFCLQVSGVRQARSR